jgi:hypothetical protein
MVCLLNVKINDLNQRCLSFRWLLSQFGVPEGKRRSANVVHRRAPSDYLRAFRFLRGGLSLRLGRVARALQLQFATPLVAKSRNRRSYGWSPIPIPILVVKKIQFWTKIE